MVMFPPALTDFTQVFTKYQLLANIIFSIGNGIFLYFASIKFVLVLQQCGYHGKRYFKWMNNKDTPYLSRLMLLCLLGFLFFCVLNMCFAPILGSTGASYIGFVSYFLFTGLYINSESSVNAKIPLRKTSRVIRLAITYVIFTAVVTFGLITLLDFAAFGIGDEIVGILRYSLICVMPMAIPIMLFLAYCINEPFEWMVRTHYVNLAKMKINRSKVLRIGITGSYAKTSVKEILRTILSQKYRVLATPASYNTPLGISMTIKRLDSSHDVFIAEMGARSKGDIKELGQLVKPKYGVLTGINSQHLESFGSIENTKNTKYELFENLLHGGIGFFSADNKYSVELSQRFEKEKYLAGIEGDDDLVTAEDVVTDSRGTSFTLVIRGENPISCRTVLLGRHNVSNICLAAAVAYKVGMTAEEIAQGINRIQSVGHRLELMPNNKNIVIIDDSYNSNEAGVTAAMEVLDMFEGRKIVLTPGLVELGEMENVANLEFGKTLASHADMVIVIGKHNAEMIINGLIDAGMPRENIRFAKTLKKGNEELNQIMQEGDVVLFENDLPDNYS